MKRLLFLAACLSVFLAGDSPRFVQSQPPETDRVAVFMHAKLDHCHKVLEGLTSENYDLLAKHSQELSLLSLAATWQVLQTPEYAQRSVEFRRSTNAIMEAARAKNLEGATLAYVDMTMKCVECHKYIRQTRMAERDPPRRR